MSKQHTPPRWPGRTHVAPRDDAQRERIRTVYSTRRWRDRVRPDKLRRDPMCQMCAVTGLVTVATEVDHRIAISLGGDAWDESNLCSLCLPCHSAKSMAERHDKPLPPIVPNTERCYVIA